MSGSSPLPDNVSAGDLDYPSVAVGDNAVDHFRRVGELLPQLIWAANAKGELDYINTQWGIFTGLKPSDPDYLDWFARIHPDDRDELAAIWQHSLETGEAYEHEFRIRDRNGDYRWFSSKAIPLLDDQGEELRWHGITSDIDAQKQAQSELAKAAKAKDDFIAMLGHELRNPLAVIKTSFANLNSGRLDQQQKTEAFELLGRQINHLTRLVGDTLDTARLNTGKLRINRQPVNLSDLAAKSVCDFTETAAEGGVTMAPLADLPAVWVNGDAHRLTQCLFNLLHNAVKFTQRGGTIKVSLCKNVDGSAELCVTDTGVGIEPHEIETLFQPFQQGKAANSQGKEGLGLGLSVISEVMRLHDGSATVTSPGTNQGATFCLVLPSIDTPAAATDADAQSPADSAAAALQICLVEDNESVAKSLELFLTLEGHTVTHIDNGVQAIDTIKQLKPDVVLSDLTLCGEKDGWQVAEELCNHFPDDDRPYLIALSGHAQSEHREKSEQAGFDQHLAKPPSFEDLRDALNRSQNSPFQ